MLSLQFPNSTASSPLHSKPPSLLASNTPRVRFLEPTLHVLEHAPHSCQLPQTQFTGQGCSLQASVRELAPSQSAPFPACSSATVRFRVRWPPPHVAVQSDTVHSLQTQSTSHGSVLHSWSSRERPVHARPPNCASFALFLVLWCIPVPHSFEQSVQPPQSLHSQFRGHMCNAHSLFSTPSRGSHVLLTPPCAYVTSARVRFCTNESHSQPVQSDHDSHRQSTSHCSKLHGCRCRPPSSQIPPCPLAMEMNARLRFRQPCARPWLHSLLQAPHSLHSP
mmetsp:Transcript_58710/g.169905  ORF Transcript_58710/g.169905 Transcript_58710/m.169905 type:complete len:278 (-) Transcript_58710:388-1221(-)